MFTTIYLFASFSATLPSVGICFSDSDLIVFSVPFSNFPQMFTCKYITLKLFTMEISRHVQKQKD